MLALQSASLVYCLQDEVSDWEEKLVVEQAHLLAGRPEGLQQQQLYCKLWNKVKEVLPVSAADLLSFLPGGR